MPDLPIALATALFSALKSRRDLVFENLALRHQPAILATSDRRQRFRLADRLVWSCLRRLWDGWKGALFLVQPATVVRWHREGFRRYWGRNSLRRPGRPRIDPELRSLVRKMATANPLWGAPRIHGELLKLGIDISESTVSRWMPRSRKTPSPSWRAFLENHVGDLVSIDFFTVPTARFQMLFCLLVLSHNRRRVRDAVYGFAFRHRVAGLGITEVLTARHLHRILGKYFDYYYRSRTHLSLGKDSSWPRPVQLPADGEIVQLPEVDSFPAARRVCELDRPPLLG